jgi:hypothetical protein
MSAMDGQTEVLQAMDQLGSRAENLDQIIPSATGLSVGMGTTSTSSATASTTLPSDGTGNDITKDGEEGEKAEKQKERPKIPNGTNPKLRYCKPYFYPYKTFVKQR